VKVWINVGLELTDEELNYLDSCRRIRKVTRARLMKRVIEAALRDMLIESVLDDSADLLGLAKGEKRHRRFAGKDSP
jgi:hypothetical protein